MNIFSRVKTLGVSALAAVGAMACVATAPSGEARSADGEPRDPSRMLEVGERAPNFEVEDQFGNPVRLADFANDYNVVLIFYPGNDTPGCTRQLCEARDDHADYRAKNALVFGVNPATAESHQAFAEKFEFPFPLLVDTNGQMIRDYGCRGTGGITTRTVYVIGKDGTIIFAERGMPNTETILASIPG